MDEPWPVFRKWAFQIVLGIVAFAALAATLAGIAIELRELKRADEELKWRQEQTTDIDWSARAPASQ